MRTKALLAAAILAAGLASSMAQTNVYSLNVVGYYNVPIPTGAGPDSLSRFKLVCNQLKPAGITSETAKLSNTFTNLPAGTIAYVWQGNSWSSSSEYLGGTDGWETDYNVPFGTGVMLKNTAGSEVSVTFIGEVMQGATSNYWGVGYSPRGSLVPQAGGISAVLGFSNVGDKAYTWRQGSDIGWSASNEYLGGSDGWENGEPTLAVGEAVMLSSLTGGSWVRNFTVPQN